MKPDHEEGSDNVFNDIGVEDSGKELLEGEAYAAGPAGYLKEQGMTQEQAARRLGTASASHLTALMR